MSSSLAIVLHGSAGVVTLWHSTYVHTPHNPGPQVVAGGGLHDLGGEGFLPHVGGGGGGGGEVALLLVGRVLKHLRGETQDPHLVPLRDRRGPENVHC
jgi:hypothetical protein